MTRTIPAALALCLVLPGCHMVPMMALGAAAYALDQSTGAVSNTISVVKSMLPVKPATCPMPATLPLTPAKLSE